MVNMFRSGALAGVLILAASGLAHADRNLTLEEALGLARAHNRDLRGARERIAIADAGVAQARAALLPTLAVQGKYTHNYKEVDFDAAPLVAPTFAIADEIGRTSGNPAQMAAIQEAE